MERRHRRSRTASHRTLVTVAALAAVAAIAVAGISAAAPDGGGWSQGISVRCAPGYAHPDVAPDGTISCSPATSTTTAATATTSATTTPSTGAPPAFAPNVPPATPVDACPAPVTTVTGARADAWDAPAAPSVDATGAVWHSDTAGDHAVSLLGDAPGACWHGGTIIGDWGPGAPWSLYHSTVALRFSQPGTTVSGVRIDGYGDALKPKDDSGGRATDWTVRGVRVDHAYDDCLENDYLHAGVLADSMLDCYVGYSARASDGQGTAPDGTVLFAGDLLRLEPQPNVYKGPSPGTGGWFKLDAHSPPMALVDVTLAAGLVPNHQDLRPPADLRACDGVTILWTGDGSSSRAPATFPETAAWTAACPGVRIVEGAAAGAEWDLRALAWNASHTVG